MGVVAPSPGRSSTTAARSPNPRIPTRTGFTFNGWFDAALGGSAWDFSGDAVTSATMLFAHWTGITYAAAFDSRGGSAVGAQTVGYDALATEPTDPTRTGYAFTGWFTAPSGGAAWDFGTDTLLADTTLYAQWSPIDYAVTFDSQGGSAVAGLTANYGDLLTEPAEPTRSGYTFAGWFTAPTGGEQWDFATDPTMTTAVLYAHWELEAGELALTGDPVMLEIQLAFALLTLGGVLLVVGRRFRLRRGR